MAGAASLLLRSARAEARAPGSEDVDEAITQIKDGAHALRKLRQEWAAYAVIDAEGRAGNIGVTHSVSSAR